MEEGTSQGCPLSPLLASFVVARLLEPIDGLLRERAAARLANGDPGDDSQGGISHLLSVIKIYHHAFTYQTSNFCVNKSTQNKGLDIMLWNLNFPCTYCP